MVHFDSASDALAQDVVLEAINRGVLSFKSNNVTYHLHEERTYAWGHPEEWVRAYSVAWLIVERGYPADRLRVEVAVPRRVPPDFADIVVYQDVKCKEPYLVVEVKASRQKAQKQKEAAEQLFGNANSLRALLALYEEGSYSSLYDVLNFPPLERDRNRLGDRSVLPAQYGIIPAYAYVAGTPNDIEPVSGTLLQSKVRRAHSLIWAGGRRDPLTAFDEWSKLLFAKVVDERLTPSGAPRRFQVGTNETTATVATRIHSLFQQACRDDATVFPAGTRINLADSKVVDVVRVLQNVSFTRTDIDSIGRAFEEFFGSIFRGGLGQYFTMRPLARFIVAMLEVTQDDYIIDPTVGSGGFLLETLLQVWHRIDRLFDGQSAAAIQRLKIDFALTHVYGVEVHDVLGRICKINLLLHHDGHTNIESNRSCLDSSFANSRLNPPANRFTCVVGNPPFGAAVEEGDEDKLGSNHLSAFTIAAGLKQIASEQVIVERSIALLEPGGRLGMILPDGLLNNQGSQSNCPRMRKMIAMQGRIRAIISLPDFAFRKSGAQNKTSILFFEKFSREERERFDQEMETLKQSNDSRSEADTITTAISNAHLDYAAFLAEANHIGYSTTGGLTQQNDLYRSSTPGAIDTDQKGSILGAWSVFNQQGPEYQGQNLPDCMSIPFNALWSAHRSHRLDPKYHLFQREASRTMPHDWLRLTLKQVLRRRLEALAGDIDPDRLFKVMTLSQSGSIRLRQAGIGNNPPQWSGAYFVGSSSDWFVAKAGDVIFSSIDLWKGCISIVPNEFDGALASKEFPIYELVDGRLTPGFLQALLRSRFYQRAFRAITTGHSNRRRTQEADFESLTIAFPPSREEQTRLIEAMKSAQAQQSKSSETLRRASLAFSNLIDGRGDEEEMEQIADDAEFE